MTDERSPAENIVPDDDYDENAVMPPTPGPWTIQPDIYDKWLLITAPDPDPKNHGMGRLEVEVLRDDCDSRVSRANARLIAAAPLLLAALEAALDQTEDGLHSGSCDVPNCWVEQAESAIAAAHGESTEGRP